MTFIELIEAVIDLISDNPTLSAVISLTAVIGGVSRLARAVKSSVAGGGVVDDWGDDKRYGDNDYWRRKYDEQMEP